MSQLQSPISRRTKGCGSAVAVTGSHNPPSTRIEDGPCGTTLAGEEVQRLRKRIESARFARGGRTVVSDIREAI